MNKPTPGLATSLVVFGLFCIAVFLLDDQQWRLLGYFGVAIGGLGAGILLALNETRSKEKERWKKLGE